MDLPADFKIDKGILELEARTGIPENFFRDLNATDDWSFVIKLHALFEAACSHLLLFHFQEPELAEVFNRLELSNKTIGKVAFLAKCGLLGKENRRFISTLSELRNSLVHDVRNAKFTFSSFIADLEAQETQRLAVAFSPFEAHIRQFPYDPSMKLGYQADMQTQATIAAVVDRFKADSKYHIWIGAYSVLVSIVDMYGYSDYKLWSRAKQHFTDDEAA
jgi:hypothetical protein